MSSFNKCILLGNLSRDPQVKQLPSNTIVAEFGLVVNHKFRSRDGTDREEVLFIDCAAFGRTGEAIGNFCKKGKPLLVEGRLKLDTWEDKQTGAKRSKISLVVDNFQFIGSRGDDEGGQAQTPQRQPSRAGGGARPRQNQEVPFSGEQEFSEDSIPFLKEWRRFTI